MLVEWAEDRWKELLGAIRGRRRSSSESKQEPDELQEEFEQQQEYERQIETAHQKSQFKHVHGLPWGDPASYVKASAPDDLEWAREHRKRADEQREQEAREFLIRESERVRKEREEREERLKTQQRESESKSEPNTPTPLIVIRSLSEEAEDEACIPAA